MLNQGGVGRLRSCGQVLGKGLFGGLRIFAGAMQQAQGTEHFDRGARFGFGERQIVQSALHIVFASTQAIGLAARVTREQIVLATRQG